MCQAFFSNELALVIVMNIRNNVIMRISHFWLDGNPLQISKFIADAIPKYTFPSTHFVIKGSRRYLKLKIRLFNAFTRFISPHSRFGSSMCVCVFSFLFHSLNNVRISNGIRSIIMLLFNKRFRKKQFDRKNDNVSQVEYFGGFPTWNPFSLAWKIRQVLQFIRMTTF